MADAFHGDLSAFLENEQILDQRSGLFGDLDLAGQAAAFGATGDVYRVSPKIVGVFPATDNAGHKGARVDAEARIETDIARENCVAQIRLHIQGQRTDRRGMVLSGSRNAGSSPPINAVVIARPSVKRSTTPLIWTASS